MTLKQCIKNDLGFYVPLNSYEIEKTGSLLRNRITRALVGRRQTIPFCTFCEGGEDGKRYHYHIALHKPVTISFEDFSRIFRDKALKLDWIYNQIDIVPIANKTQQRVIGYSLKTGVEAFLPGASSVLQSS